MVAWQTIVRLVTEVSGDWTNTSAAFEHFPKITKRLEEVTCFLTIMIHIRQVDLIAEEDHPFSKLHRSQNDSIRSSSVLAVMVKCLKQ